MASLNNNATGKQPNKLGMDQAAYEQKVTEFADVDQRFVSIIASYEDFYETLEQMSAKSTLAALEQEHKAYQDAMQKRLQDTALSAEDRAALEREAQEELNQFKRESAAEIERVQNKAIEVTLTKQVNAYKYATAAEKAEIAEANAARLEAWAAEKQKEADLLLATEEGNKEVQLAAIREAAEARRIANEITRSQQFEDLNAIEDKLKNFKQDAANGDFSVISSVLKLSSKDLDKLANDAQKRAEKSKAEFEDMKKDYQKLEDAGASEEELQQKMQELVEKQSEMMRDEMSSVLADVAADFKNAVNKEFEYAEELIVNSKAKIEGRLQGSDKTYNKIMDKIASNTSLSPFVKTKNVIEKMQDAADKGLAYNIEQRSFLATISEKIASTFDAFEGNLTRLIKLQQADTTAARLGMEASLTKFFNGMFQDSTYLKDVSDSISSAIIDANASMSRDMSASFEHTVQKWLGSLYSLGMDQGTLTQIAQGINYIATGDVTSLSSNESLQTLFAMSASNAGLSYSDLLLNGLNAETTNKLLESMVIYLKDIAENSDNQVVRSAYGNIFNLSMSDMKAISNLTSSDISKISGTSLSYNNMMTELNKQFALQITRTTLGGMVDTLYENATFGVAEDLVSNPATYAMYKMLHFMEERNFDMNIPFVNAAGFGLDLNTSVQDLLNLGLGASSALSLATNILAGLGSAGGMNLDMWSADDYTSRGGGLVFTTGTSGASTSSSTSVSKRGGTGSSDGEGPGGAGSYVASGSSSDMKNSTLSSATDDADETSKITNKNAQSGYTMDDFYKAVVEGSEPYLRVTDHTLETVHMDSGNYLSTRDTRMLYTKDNYLKVQDMGFSGLITPLHNTIQEILSITRGIGEDTGSLLKQAINMSNVLAGIAYDATAERIKLTDFTPEKTYSALDKATIRVSNVGTDTEGLDVFVTNLESQKSTTQIVKFESTPTVNIPKDVMVSAFKEAMGFSGSGTYNFKTVAKILNDLYEGKSSIQVSNPPESPLHTTTELTDGTLLKLRIATL